MVPCMGILSIRMIFVLRDLGFRIFFPSLFPSLHCARHPSDEQTMSFESDLSASTFGNGQGLVTLLHRLTLVFLLLLPWTPQSG